MNKLGNPESLQEWNRALITAVFLKAKGSRTSLSRIDTTGRILMQITGDKVSESAKRRFIEAFATDNIPIREYFKWTPRISVLTTRDGMPPTFAALYLTLLAASADDITYTEGNFRSRFSALFQTFAGLKDINVNFIELPRLWRQVAGWSRQRAEEKNDCVRLILPDPKHETQIGYSKRLAFPTYKDEKILRSLLFQRKLNSDSDFKKINDAIYSQLSTFSDSFREEIAAFNSYVAKAQYQLAYNCPLWGAVRDITWQEEDERKQKNGIFCLQLDASDPQTPELYFLTDEIGAKLIDSKEKFVLTRARGDYSFIYQSANGKTSIASLISLNDRHEAIFISKVGKSLQSGAIALFPDSLGSLSSDGEYHESGTVCFLLRAEIANSLLRTFNHLGLKWSEITSSDVLDNWKGFIFESLSKICLNRISTELPEWSRNFIKNGWKPPQPRLSGGARYQQAIFLNPASNPLVHMLGADGGRYQLLGSGMTVVAEGKLINSENELYIPPGDLIGLRELQVCRYSFMAGLEIMDAILDVPIVTEVPARAIPPLSHVEEWVTDGPAGTMVPSTDLINVTKAKEHKCSPIRGSLWPLEKKPISPYLPCYRSKLDTQIPALEWLSEALFLRFQRRSSLPFDVLDSHIKMASEASGVPNWKLKRLLFASSWLQVMERRTAPYAAVLPSQRTVSHCTHENGILARISGMFSIHEQKDLLSRLEPQESLLRLKSANIELSLGCLELKVSSVGKLMEISKDFGLEQFSVETMSNPLGGVFHPITKASWIERIPNEEGVKIWDSLINSWIDIVAHKCDWERGNLLKRIGRQRNTYWVSSEGGYWSTDSSIWAWMFRQSVQGAALGILYENGDVTWTSQIHSLPAYLNKWWMHSGGGCIGISNEGNHIFLGGKDQSFWSEALPFDSNQIPSIDEDRRPANRRALALKLRVRLQRNSHEY